MFEQIHFISYDIPPKPISSAPPQARGDLTELAGEVTHARENSKNMKNTQVYMNGNMKTFAKAPVPPFAVEHLFHMEAFTVFTCGGDCFTRRSDYPSFMILYTYRGMGRLDYEGKSYSLGPGDGFFIDCSRPQFYRSCGEVWEHSVFHLNGPLVPALFEDFLSNGPPVFSQPLTGNYHTGLELLLNIYSSGGTYRDWQASHCISGILNELLLGSAKNNAQSNSMPENIRFLIKYMDHNFTSALSLDFLASFSGLSKYYLSREFKKYTGYSPNDYLIRLRVEYAKSLLLSTTLPANKIAHMAGVHDINNFTNLFRRKTGMTPGEFRVQR